MRVAIIGQQDFGKATLEAFLNRGDTVAAVFCAPEKGRPDPLRVAAQERGMTVHQFPKLTDPAALEAMKAGQRRGRRDGLRHPVRSPGVLQDPEIRHHPVPSQPAAAASRRLVDELGDHLRAQGNRVLHFPPDRWSGRRTGDPDALGADRARGHARHPVFRQGLPDGRRRRWSRSPNMVVAGKAPALAQYEPNAGYEGIIREAETRINWANHVDITLT